MDNLAFVFDIGNVLIDWNPRHLYLKLFNGDREAVERFLKEIEFDQWNFRQDQGRPFAVGVAEHCARFPQYCDLIRAYDVRWEETINGPIDGTITILHSLWRAGYPLFGLSNWSVEKFQLVRSRFDFLDWFTTILISGSVGMAKPEPAIFRLLLEWTGRSAEECILIDDSPQNIHAAQRLGFRTILFRSPNQLKRALRKFL